MDKLKRWRQERRDRKHLADDLNEDDPELGSRPPMDDIDKEYDKLERLNARDPGLTREQKKAAQEAERQRASERQRLLKARKTRLRAALPDVAANPFTYQPLPTAHAQIRLIEVRTTADNNIYCHIESHELSQAPSFIAMSYTWGTEHDDRWIYLNSQPRKVRHNCWSALRQVTKRKLEGWIWIDAICINQLDNDERASQVQLMTALFGKAEWVAVVLQQNIILNTALHQVSFAKTMVAKSEELVKDIFNDAFFTRIWTVQEILVAKEVRIFVTHTDSDLPEYMNDDNHHDHEWLFLPDLEGLVDAATNAGWPSSGGLQRVQRLVKDVAQEQKRPKDPSHQAYFRHASNVFRYLIKYDDLSCEEARDRIYALLPMALRGTKAPKLVPDYNEPLLGVLADLIEYMGGLLNTQYGQSASSFSDILVCLMKLTQSFGLTLEQPEVQSFFEGRLEGTANAALTVETPNTSKGPNHTDKPGFLEFRGICVKDVNDPKARIVLHDVGELQADLVTRLSDMGFDTGWAGADLENLRIVCDGAAPALITTKNIRPGDIILTPFAGPMAWTWNLVFRASSTEKDRYELVGQAVPLKGGNRAQLGRGQCCQDETCPAHSSSMRVYLHPQDILSLALLSREPVERLKRPATTPKCGSYAIITGTRSAAASTQATESSVRHDV